MKNYWKATRLWPNSTIFILGGGPTLLDTLAGRELRQYPVIGVNDACVLGDWVDVLMFDARWYWWSLEQCRSFRGLKVTLNCHPELYDVSQEPGVNVMKYKYGHGLIRDPRYLNFNRSNGAAAINLAYHLGADEVVLLGFDMRRVNGRKNWYDRQEVSKPNPYSRFLEPFPKIKRDAKALGLKIINATPGSKLKCFPFVALDSYL